MRTSILDSGDFTAAVHHGGAPRRVSLPSPTGSPPSLYGSSAAPAASPRVLEKSTRPLEKKSEAPAKLFEVVEASAGVRQGPPAPSPDGSEAAARCAEAAEISPVVAMDSPEVAEKSPAIAAKSPAPPLPALEVRALSPAPRVIARAACWIWAVPPERSPAAVAMSPAAAADWFSFSDKLTRGGLRRPDPGRDSPQTMFSFDLRRPVGSHGFGGARRTGLQTGPGVLGSPLHPKRSTT
jgi:hypothetical protein